MLPEAHRHRAITNFGSAERLRVVVDKLTKGAIA